MMDYLLKFRINKVYFGGSFRDYFPGKKGSHYGANGENSVISFVHKSTPCH